ncbi:MAG TPA: hypothetical protein [Caudoviricetes sp.]|uniref:Uncharacterized protein n=1 Tax=Phage Phass-1 TaxID=3043662 RepID=A0AAF0LX57_9CAUD|nr:hypothetical protein [Phage Phass-1]DAT81415.1 MAG TPA: hypothetical protein [Caudoviricetes sp.]
MEEDLRRLDPGRTVFCCTAVTQDALQANSPSAEHLLI